LRGAEIELRVADNGKGIAPDMLEKVFDLFVQVEPFSSTALGGLGVGLALVRRVVELHGGSVTARSAGLGFGCEFTVRLPLSTEGLRAVSPEALSPVPSHRLRVLVVDDNHDAADSLSLLIGSMGQDVFTAYDGESALAAAHGFRPDVVLLDIGMPHMSGYEVAQSLREIGAEKPAVLVAITGWGQDADRERATAAGFRYHFVKPIGEAVLRTILEEIAVARRG